MSGFYSVMPSYVLDDDTLNPNAKLLYLEISRLCNVRGYCWAGNDFFSKKMKTTTRSIRNWLQELKAAGHVFSIIERGTRRKIYLDKRCEQADHTSFQDAMKADLNRQPGADEDIDQVAEIPDPELERGGNLVPISQKEAEHTFLHNTIPLEKNIIKKVTSVTSSRASPDVAKEIGKQVLKTMTGVFPITRDEYPLHAKKARQIADRVCEMAPDAPTEAAGVVLAAFRDLVEHGDGFWRKQPYTAPTLASVGIWSRVVAHIRQVHNTYRGTEDINGKGEWDAFMEDVW